MPLADQFVEGSLQGLHGSSPQLRIVERDALKGRFILVTIHILCLQGKAKQAAKYNA
jgi:hypothetical protein